MSRLIYFKNLTLLILCGEAIFFLPFVLVRIFRPTILKAFDLNNTELGYAFSIYGMIAVGAYFLGGFIADRFPAKNLIAISLILTGSLGFIMAEIPDFSYIILIYAGWGISTILLFWSPMKKSIRLLGGPQNQGKTFGGAEAGRGLTAAILGSLVLLLFADFELESEVVVVQKMYRMTSVFIIGIGLLIYFFLDLQGEEKTAKLDFSGFKKALKIRALWHQMFFVLSAYVAYKCTDDFSLYAYDVMGFDDADAGAIGTMTLYIRPVAALGLGFLADRFSVRLMSLLGFALTLIGSICFYAFDFESLIFPFFINIVVLSVGIYSLRALYYAIMNEGGIPMALTGTAVGLVSVVGYTPDIFMGPIMGYFLDQYPGVQGHQYLFGFCGVFALLGLINLYYFPKSHKKVL